jgi:hypothetical protein
LTPITHAGQKDKDSDDSGMGDNSAIEPTLETSLRNSLKKLTVSPEIKAEAYRAIDSYQANGAGQVSFEIGDTIHVLDKLEDGEYGLLGGRGSPTHIMVGVAVMDK